MVRQKANDRISTIVSAYLGRNAQNELGYYFTTNAVPSAFGTATLTFTTNAFALDGTTTIGGGGGSPSIPATDVSVLHSLAADPAVADYEVGDIANVGGEFKELLSSTDSRNVYYSKVASRTGNFVGDDAIEWESVSPNNIRWNPLKSSLTTQPASVFIEFHTGNRWFETKLDRASGSDTATTYAYHKASGSPGIEEATIGANSTLYYSD